MAKNGNLEFSIQRRKNLSIVIRKKQDELTSLVDKCLVIKNENNILKEEITKRKANLERTEKSVEVLSVELNKKKSLLLSEIDKLEKDYNNKKDSFSGKIKDKKIKLISLEDKTDEIERQIKPIVEIELMAFEIEKEKLEKVVTSLLGDAKKLQLTVDSKNKKYNELVELHREEESRLDKKLEELSLRESENIKLRNKLVVHAKRINNIYQKLGKDNIIINT